VNSSRIAVVNRYRDRRETLEIKENNAQCQNTNELKAMSNVRAQISKIICHLDFDI
jgi:hypothetical protein